VVLFLLGAAGGGVRLASPPDATDKTIHRQRRRAEDSYGIDDNKTKWLIRLRADVDDDETRNEEALDAGAVADVPAQLRFVFVVIVRRRDEPGQERRRCDDDDDDEKYLQQS
jgi:hypothetical protein